MAVETLLGGELAANELRVEVPDGMRAYIDPVLLRLGYLYPEVTFSKKEGTIVAECEKGGLPARRELLHQVYREKIYQDGLTMRELMYKTVLA